MTGKPYDKLARIAYVVLAALFAVQASALAQTENNAARPERGISPLGSYAVSDIESISLTNGNLNLSIPLASLPPIAGGKLSWGVRAIYNSKMWDLIREEIDPGVLDQFGNPAAHYNTSRLQLANGQGGWHIGETYSITFQNSRDDYNWLPPACGPFCSGNECGLLTGNQFRKTILTTPDGGTHELRPLDYMPYQGSRDFLWGYYTQTPNNICANPNTCPPSGCTSGQIRYYSFDGSFMWAKINVDFSWELYLPDGTKITQSGGIQRIIDTNGNSIKIYSDPNGAGHTVTHYLDERGGREITQEWIPGSGNQYTLRVSYKLVGGTSSALVDVNFNTISVVGKTYQVTDHFSLTGEQCFRLEPLGAVVDVVKSISLPPTEPNQTRSFTFGYNCDTTHSTNGQYQPACDPASAYPVGSDSIGWGSLNRMTMPSGAVAQYTYSLDNVQELSTDVQQSNGFETVEASRESVTSKSLIHDGQAADVWTYTIATMGGGNVVGPDGGKTQELIYAHDPAYSNVYGGSTGLGGMAYRTSQFDKAGLEKTRIERHWVAMKFTGAFDISPGQPSSLAPFNPVVDVEYTTLFDSTGGFTNAKMTAKKFTYDYNGNLAVEQDYDWFSPSALPGRDAQGVPTGIPSGLQPIRVVNNSYYNPAPLVTGGDTGANTGNVYAKRSISNVTPLILNAKKDTSGSSATWGAPL